MSEPVASVELIEDRGDRGRNRVFHMLALRGIWLILINTNRGRIMGSMERDWREDAISHINHVDFDCPMDAQRVRDSWLPKWW